MHAMLLDTTTGYREKEHDFNGKKKVKPALGTEAYVRIDGRLNMGNAARAAEEYYNEKKRLKKYIGFALYSGTISNPQLVSYFVEKEYKNLETDLKNG